MQVQVPAQEISTWIAGWRSSANPAIRLFCFPYAGGGAQIYRIWQKYLPPDLEVCPVQLPGRESRIGEAPLTNLNSLVKTLADVLAPLFDQPFAFFGHSMGAVIAFELAHLLKFRNFKPQRLFVSGHRAPHLPNEFAPIYQLPEDKFVNEVRRLNGTPEEVLAHPELMQLLIPLLRADFEMVQTYKYLPLPPLDCSITALGGTEDSGVTREHLADWRIHTTADFNLQMFSGDHFYLRSRQTEILRLLELNLIS